MFEIGKKYKIQDLNDIYYTATIIEETENAILFSDLYGQVQGIAKGQIKRWIEVKE